MPNRPEVPPASPKMHRGRGDDALQETGFAGPNPHRLPNEEFIEVVMGFRVGRSLQAQIAVFVDPGDDVTWPVKPGGQQRMRLTRAVPRDQRSQIVDYRSVADSGLNVGKRVGFMT